MPLARYVAEHGLALTRFGYLVAGDRGRAEDLVQEVYLALYRRFGDSLPADLPAAYARTAIVRAQISQGRRRRFPERPTAELPEPSRPGRRPGRLRPAVGPAGRPQPPATRACWCCATATAAPTPRSPRRWAAGGPPSAAWPPARWPTCAPRTAPVYRPGRQSSDDPLRRSVHPPRPAGRRAGGRAAPDAGASGRPTSPRPARPAWTATCSSLPTSRTHRLDASRRPGGRRWHAVPAPAGGWPSRWCRGSAFCCSSAVRCWTPGRSAGQPTGRPTNPAPAAHPATSVSRPRCHRHRVQPLDCPLPASWAQRSRRRQGAVDQPQNYPMSAGPDGTFLMLQSAVVTGQTDTHQELAIFDRNGHGTTIWHGQPTRRTTLSTSAPTRRPRPMGGVRTDPVAEPGRLTESLPGTGPAANSTDAAVAQTPAEERGRRHRDRLQPDRGRRHRLLDRAEVHRNSHPDPGSPAAADWHSAPPTPVSPGRPVGGARRGGGAAAQPQDTAPTAISPDDPAR